HRVLRPGHCNQNATSCRASFDAVIHQDAPAVEWPALDQFEFYSLAAVAQCGNSRTKQDGMNVESNFIDDARAQQRRRKIAPAHDDDVLAWLGFKGAHEFAGV